MLRLFFIAFGWEWLSRDERHLHEAPPIQTVPVIILATGGVVAGYIPVANFLSPIFGNPVEVNITVVLTLAGLSVLVALAGFGMAYLLHARRTELAVAWRPRPGPRHRLAAHRS